MVPWGIPGWCPGPPWGFPGASRGALRAGFQTQLKIHEKNEEFWEAPGTSWEAPGDPEGLQKSIKNRFVAPKGCSKRVFLPIFVQLTIFYVFCAIVHRFLAKQTTKNCWKKTMHFFSAAVAFLNMVTLTKHRTLCTESHFFIFRVFAFFPPKTSKNWTQNADSIFSSKNLQKLIPGDLFWVPKWSRINVGEAKKPKNGPKKSFFARVIFWMFFRVDLDRILEPRARVPVRIDTKTPDPCSPIYI